MIGALTVSWDVFVSNLTRLGPALILLNIFMLILGLYLSRLARLSAPIATSISLETSIQNATIGITVGSLVAGQASGHETFSAFSIVSGVYGIIMDFVSLPFVLWRRFNT